MVEFGEERRGKGEMVVGLFLRFAKTDRRSVSFEVQVHVTVSLMFQVHVTGGRGLQSETLTFSHGAKFYFLFH